MFPLKDNIPNERFPLVTVVLIVLNVVAYLLSIRHGGSLIGGPADTVSVHYGAIPFALTHPGTHCDLLSVPDAMGNAAQGIGCQSGPAPGGQPPTWETALTSMFLHGGILHIAGNMLFLAIFGPNVEDSFRSLRFLAFYLVGGLVALGAEVLVGPGAMVPTLGASGAVAAVLGAYILLFPRARILTVVFIIFFFTLLELPALVVLGFWFVEQVLFGALGQTNPVGSSGGVAYFAHVGGFLFGLAVVGVFARRMRAAASGAPRYPVY